MECRRCGGVRSERLVRLRWPLVTGAYVAGLMLAYVLGGALLHDLAEGLRRDMLPLWKAWTPLAVLLLAVAATFVHLRRPVCDACGIAEPPWLLVPVHRVKSADITSGSTRRLFLRMLGAGGAASVAALAGLATAVGRNWAWLHVFNDFFRTPVEKGIEIIRALRGHTSGLAVPYFVVDAPNGGGKIPINPDYVVRRDGKRWVLRNYAGKEFEYLEP